MRSRTGTFCRGPTTPTEKPSCAQWRGRLVRLRCNWSNLPSYNNYFACVVKVKIVVLCMVSPGFSVVVGKSG